MLALKLSIGLATYYLLSVALSASLPVVDLGYAVHEASVNSSGAYPLYTFSNVRFGAPPIGDLRFLAPVAPRTVNRTTTNGGATPIVCAQATPTWIAAAVYLLDGIKPPTASNSSSSKAIPTPSAGETEDCLFLDVVVPEKVFSSEYAKSCRSGNESANSKGAPVIVWLNGGGYVSGDKTGSGSARPASLLAKSIENDQEGVVYVAINYRLGLFGWQASTAFQAEGGIPNAGLLDQRMALEWIQKYIYLFGGDPSRVTVIGESAGAGSILHHITAPSSHNTSSLFTQAITQSPAFQPITSTQQTITYETTFAVIKKYCRINVTTLAELQSLPFACLYTANVLQVAISPYGEFTFGPTVDGSYVPALPGQQFLNGNYDHAISVIAARNGNEGALFTSPDIINNTAFSKFVQNLLPEASNSTLDHILTVLYPPVFDGAYPYLTQLERAQLIISEFTITCNSYFVASAMAHYSLTKPRWSRPTAAWSQAWKYIFSVPPAYHSTDIPYTFFNGDTTSRWEIGLGTVDPVVAGVLQDFIVSFVQDGYPSSKDAKVFEGYRRGVYDLNSTGLGTMYKDPDDNERCRYWQAASWTCDRQ